MKKCIAILFIAAFISASLFCTPDRSRIIIDNLIGYIGNDLIILQYVYDNNGSHYDQTQELYLITKTVSEGKLVVKSQQRIPNANVLGEYFSKIGFYYAMPTIINNEYLVLSNKSGSINYLGTEYKLDTIIPKELSGFLIDHIECIYENKENSFIVLIIEDKKHYEQMRKVFLLK